MSAWLKELRVYQTPLCVGVVCLTVILCVKLNKPRYASISTAGGTAYVVDQETGDAWWLAADKAYPVQRKPPLEDATGSKP